MMKAKKVISSILSAAMITSIVSINVMASVNLPILWDIDNNQIPDEISISNKATGFTASIADPTDASNKVAAIQNVTGDVLIKVPIAYTSTAIQMDFDFYRDGHAGNDFTINLYDSAGNELIVLDLSANTGFYISSGSGLTNKGNGLVEDKKWYSMRIISNAKRSEHEIYLKERGASDYTFIGTSVTSYNAYTGDDIVYGIKNRSSDVTYLDNISFSESREFVVDLPVLWDIDNNQIPGEINISNKATGYAASTADPTDTSNKVVSVQNVTGDVLIKVPIAYTESSIQMDFDIYRDGHSGNDFTITMHNGDTEVIIVDLSANDGFYIRNGASLAHKGNGLVEDKKWYSLRIISNSDRNEHEVYLKERDAAEYSFIGTAVNDAISSAGENIVYGIKNRSSDVTYLDNISFSESHGSFHDDFDNVEEKTGSYYSDSAGSLSATWKQAEFAGEQVLEVSNTGDVKESEIQSWQRLPAMDKVYVEVRMGLDGTDAAGLPYQMGIRPVFATRQWSEGLRFEQSRYFQAGGLNPRDEKGDVTQGWNGKSDALRIKDGVLYTAGLVYDKSNKVLRYYFIDNYGETYVISSLADGTLDENSGYKNATVQDGKYLGERLQGVALYLRGRYINDTEYYGSGYFDYLHIDEAPKLEAESVDISNDADGVSVKIDYNYVIDPKKAGDVAFRAADGTGDIPGDVSTYNGKTLVITPSETLKSGGVYTLVVSGVSDLLGNTADSYTTSIKVAEKETEPMTISEISLNSDGNLIDGMNTVKVTLDAADEMDHDIILIAALYDAETNELLGVKLGSKTVAGGETEDVTVEYDTSEYSNYVMKAYVWDTANAMKPYIGASEFTK